MLSSRSPTNAKLKQVCRKTNTMTTIIKISFLHYFLSVHQQLLKQGFNRKKWWKDAISYAFEPVL
jgi:hypothetical protein